MISICIPIYNFNISQLIYELSQQLSSTEVPMELILIDDCSSEEFKQLNESSCKNHTYIELDKNIGRARIRNLFVEYAQYENLLFLDCDSLIISNDFLSNYINAIKKGTNNIICGGRIYDSVKPEKNKILRWKYGVKRESLLAKERNIQPHKSFMTNNFLIKKKILAEIKFDERLREYGHEDTLFGFELKKNDIAIKHIENPVLNGDIEDNKEYIAKTEKGILNLILIANNAGDDFIQEVSILRFYHKINAKKLIVFIDILFPFLKPFIKYFLVNGYANLQLLDFYKLGILIKNYKKNQL
ncbi:MAG: glycosyltransferase [Bacteroidales bacterium]|jgi:hypothetical protein|nr:glycosyltransferase [Bacteroidales bacterium]